METTGDEAEAQVEEVRRDPASLSFGVQQLVLLQLLDVIVM